MMVNRDEISCGVPSLIPVKVADTATGIELLPQEIEVLFWNHIDHVRICQNEMIRVNLDLPNKTGSFGNEWARRNVRLVSLPDTFRNLSHQNRVNQCEVARIVSAWLARERVATAIDHVGWFNATYKNVCEELGKDIDRNLFTNVLNHEGHFSVPEVKNTRFSYDQSNNNSCRQGELDLHTGIVTYRRVAVADRFVDITLCIPHFKERYPNAIRVSRPTMRRNSAGNIVFDVVVFVSRPQRVNVSKSSHVVGFDLNADWHGGISGARLAYNGNVSRELTVSVDTQRQQDKLERLYVQYQRCLTKLKNLMPWQRASNPNNPEDVAAHPQWARLYNHSIVLRDKMYRIKELLDWRYAHDMLNHAKANELIAVEKLDSFDAAGRYEFRHGSQLSKLEHVAAKQGKRVVKVNPAHTSDTCPYCNSRIDSLGKAREYQCAHCLRTIPRDYGSAINIAKRGCSYLGHKHVKPTPKKGHPTAKRPKLIRKQHSGVASKKLSGTGKGPASFHAQNTTFNVVTAIVYDKRKHTTTSQQLGQCCDVAMAGTITTSS